MLKTSSIDGTLIPSFAFKDTTSYSGKHHKTGTKVSLVVEVKGIPLAAVEAPGATHDMPLAIPTIENVPAYLVAFIENLLGDKGYDSTPFRIFLYERGIASDIPQRELPMSWQEKLRKQQERRNQKSNSSRFVSERTNAWTKSFRRLRFRFDYSMLSFTAFLNLAFVVICVRKLLP